MNRPMYAVIGGFVGALFAMVVGSFFPLGVQSQANHFGEITCTGLKVVNKDNVPRITLDALSNTGIIEIDSSEDSALPNFQISSPVGLLWISSKGMWLFGRGDNTGAIGIDLDKYRGRIAVTGGGKKIGKVQIGVNENGGEVAVLGRGDNTGAIGIDLDKDGGRITVTGGDEKADRVHIGVNENGGEVVVLGKGKNAGLGQLGISNSGSAHVAIYDKYTKDVQAMVGASEDGGQVSVYGKAGVEGDMAAIMINSHGKGKVGVWNKYGTRVE